MAHQRRTRYRNLEWEAIPSGSLGPIESDERKSGLKLSMILLERDREIQGRLLFMTFTALFARSVLAELQQDCYPLFIEHTRLCSLTRPSTVKCSSLSKSCSRARTNTCWENAVAMSPFSNRFGVKKRHRDGFFFPPRWREALKRKLSKI